MKRKSNKKAWEALKQPMSDYLIQAGWFETAKYDNGTPIGGIAAVQNYGATINQNITEKQRKFLMLLGIFLKKTTTTLHIVIPPTHFMENCQNKNKEKWKELIKKAWAAVFLGKIEPDKAMEKVGGVIERDLLREITDGNYPPDKPLTVKAKLLKYKDQKTEGDLNKRLSGRAIMTNALSHKVEKI